MNENVVNRHFPFCKLLRRSDIELLPCVCWLDKVVLLVQCCVLQISGIQGTPLHPVSCRTLQFFAILAMDVDSLTLTQLVPLRRTRTAAEKLACLEPQGLEPPAKPPTKLGPKAAKPRAKPSTKSAAKPAAQMAAKPAAGEPIPLSMCSSSESNTPARKSGTQSQFLSRAEHASQQAAPGSFCGSYFCLHNLFCVALPLHSNWG